MKHPFHLARLVTAKAFDDTPGQTHGNHGEPTAHEDADCETGTGDNEFIQLPKENLGLVINMTRNSYGRHDVPFTGLHTYFTGFFGAL